jgi:pimeloyl-ACP methyl ester carboxylesterase
MEAAPNYVTIGDRQMRVWRAGTGPGLVVLPGLAVGAAVAAARLASICQGWSVTVVELPGTWPHDQTPSQNEIEHRVAAVIEALALERSVLIAIDMTSALAEGIVQRLPSMVSIRVAMEVARAWARHVPSLPPLMPRADGTHLTSLFAHLRDLEILESSNRSRPARQGATYLDVDERHDTFVAWAANPLAYAHLWDLCVAGIKEVQAGSGGSLAHACASVEDLPTVLALLPDRRAPAAIPATQPLSEDIWFDYADIADGRVHLRCAGPPGKRPLLMFQSAPGSSAPLSGLIESLAANHQVIAPDYLGNGDSAKPQREVDIALLAKDALQLADRLDLRTFDLWGTHTGALIALELALIAPDRVGRAVLEAPPLLAADVSKDILANYLPPLIPDKWGLHVQQAWNMRRDMFLFWPWYRQRRDAVRPLGLPDDATLHDWAVGLLKSGRTYDLSYRAAFEYETAQRLPLLKCLALICAGPADMLADGLDRARSIAPRQVSVTATPATVWYPNQAPAAVAETVAIYESFLSGA